ncbi:MAG: hypothetical protein AABY09_02535 [Nanoarchaeota archaeon]
MNNFKLYMERSKNELALAGMIFEMSLNGDIQVKVFNAVGSDTYFSAVISHSYYSIFYAAKGYLMSKGIETKHPDEHRKTYESFKSLVDKGFLDVDLLKLYESVLVKADTMLEIFRVEKGKRAMFTYHRLPQANREPASESLENAKTFYRHISQLLS